MNIKAYISSGILEAYALGELPVRERAELEKLLLEYPELQEELSRIEETQEKLLMAAAIKPRPALKKEILDNIATEKETKVVSLSYWKLAVAASVTLTLITSYLAIDYRNRWKDSENQLTAYIAQNRQMAENYNQVNERVNRMEGDLEIMGNPQFQRVVMTSISKSAPEAMASVYWNSTSSELYLKIQNMKSLAADQQYQLWAIIDGKPVDAGVFDGNVNGMIKMKDIGKGAVTFAVTIEPRGGKPTPTVETMQVAGNVSKG